MTTTRSTDESTVVPALFVSIEMSERHWQFTYTTGLDAPRYRRTVSAWDWDGAAAGLAAARRRFRLDGAAPVACCYEAGREGFAPYRWLRAQGVQAVVLDPASLRVDRRKRRAKTDRLDGDGLVTALIYWYLGDRSALRVVRVPSRPEEGARAVARELETLTRECTRTTNQLRSLLLTHGLRMPFGPTFLTRVAEARDWAGEPLPAPLQDELGRLWARRTLLVAQQRELERTTGAAIRAQTLPGAETVARLMRLRGVGLRGAVTLGTELFAWRQFQNRRQVGGYLGLGSAPYASGQQTHDQGIAKAGNRHARRVMIPLAWAWLRLQPDSALTRWFHQRFGGGGPHARRRGIVALARRLAIAFWRYLQDGTLPAGAVLKAT
jgi:transposase